MMTIHDCADYIIHKLTEGDSTLNVLKLQKLMYYVQAWHLAILNQPAFAGEFEAWVHGPVNRDLYDRFRSSHMLYSAVTAADITRGFRPETLSADDASFVSSVLDSYGGFSGSQLEELTHAEQPWVKARGALGPTDRCETVISQKSMGEFYRARLTASHTRSGVGMAPKIDVGRLPSARPKIAFILFLFALTCTLLTLALSTPPAGARRDAAWRRRMTGTRSERRL